MSHSEATFWFFLINATIGFMVIGGTFLWSRWFIQRDPPAPPEED